MGAVLESRRAHLHHRGRRHPHDQTQPHFLDGAFQLGQTEEAVLPVSMAFQVEQLPVTQLSTLALVCCAEHQQLVLVPPQLKQTAADGHVQLLTVEAAEERHHQQILAEEGWDRNWICHYHRR